MSLIKLEQFENVVATGLAKVVSEVMYPSTIEYIQLVLGGGAFTKAMITRLTVKLDQKLIMDLASGTQLQSVNSFDVDGAPVTHLYIPFANHRARSLDQQYMGAPDLGALGVKKVEIAVQITGATTPTLYANASLVPTGVVTGNAQRMVRAFLRTQLTPAAALNEQPQPGIATGREAGAFIRRLHFFSALVTQLSIKRDKIDYYEKIVLADNNANLTRMGKVPQANIFTYDAIEDDNELKWLSQIRSINNQAAPVPQTIAISTSAGGAFDVVADVFADPNAL